MSPSSTSHAPRAARAMLLLSLLLCAAHSVASLNSADLIAAYNTGLMKAVSKGLISDLERQYPGVDLTDMFSCAPTPDAYSFVPAESATGSLKEVLRTRVLKVGALKFSTNDGDYNVDPPTGFLPDFLTAVVNEMNLFYDPAKTNPIVIERNYTDAFRLLDRGEVYMTDVYYYLTSAAGNMPTFYHFQPGCIGFGYQSKFTVLKTRNVDSMQSMRFRILEGRRDELYKIAALSEADYADAISGLPALHNYEPVIVQNYEDLVSKVLANDVFAGFTSGLPASQPEIVIYPSGLISPRAALFTRPELP